MKRKTTVLPAAVVKKKTTGLVLRPWVDDEEKNYRSTGAIREGRMASPPAASIFNTISNSLYMPCAFLLEWGKSTTPRENGQAGFVKITSRRLPILEK
jgi:hypothetical protein